MNEFIILWIFCAAMFFCIFVFYPLFEIFVEKYIWQSKKSVWEILKGIF